MEAMKESNKSGENAVEEIPEIHAPNVRYSNSSTTVRTWSTRAKKNENKS